MGVTIKRIAEEAKVSPAAVSLALNNKEGVSKSTRKRILEINQRLIAEENEKNSHLTIGKGTIKFLKIHKHRHVLSPDHEAFIFRYIDGAESAARMQGYNLEVDSLDFAKITDTRSYIRSSSAAGAVVLATELTDQDLNHFEEIGIPIVFIDAIKEHRRLDYIDMNNAEALNQVVQHFVENNHSKIGIIRSTVEADNLELRFPEFQKALRYYGLPFREEFVFTVDSTFDGAYSEMCRILEKNRELPTAIFSSNDLMAYASIKAFKKNGIAVPDDISIIGFDDLPISELMEPKLTTIRVSQRQIGQMAVNLISDRLNNRVDVPSIKISVGGSLVKRDSVKRWQKD